MPATYTLIFCRITIAFLFLFSFGSKVLAFRDFAVTIGDFKLLPRHWSKTGAVLFLGSELATTILITISARLVPLGFLVALALLIVFSAALIMALWRNIETRCNCFGRTERRISRYDVARNLVLILCCLIGLWMLRYPPQSVSGDEMLLLALMSVGGLTLIANLEDVIETLRHPFLVNEERR